MNFQLLNMQMKISPFSASVRWNSLRLVAGVFIFFILFEAFSKDKSSFDVGKPEVLDSVGLKFRQIQNSFPVPLPALVTMKLKASNGEPIVSYVPKALWTYEEVILQWKNPAGTLVLAKMTLPTTEGLKIVFEEKDKSAKYCLKEEFDSWKKNAVPERDDKSIVAWLNYLTGAEFKAPLAVRKGNSKVPAVRKFTGSKGDSTLWALELTQTGNKDYVPIFFIFNVDTASDLSRDERTLNQFVAGITFAAPVKNNVPKEFKESRNTANEGKEDKELSPELIASRDAAIKSIKDLKGWWSQTTDNFMIISNVEDKKTTRDLELSLERCRSIFMEYYPFAEPLKDFNLCRVFQSQEGYLAYVGEGGKWNTAVWMSVRKELAISPQILGALKSKKDFIPPALCHGSFQQYLYYVSGEWNSTWFAEGNTAYFEGIEFKTRGKYDIATCPKYLDDVLRMASKDELPVAEVFSMDGKTFYAKDASQDNYATVWAIVYYLRNGCQLMGKRRNYENVLSRYYDSVRKLKNPDKASEFAFEGIDLKDFAKDVTAFFKEGAATVKKSETLVPIKYLSSEPKKKGDWWENTPEENTDESKDTDKE